LPVRRMLAALVWVAGAAFATVTGAEEISNPYVEISGVDEDIADAIRHSLPVTRERCSTPQRRLRHQIAGARTEIQQLLTGIGYYQSTVDTRFERDSDEYCWVLHIDIEPGPPVLLDQVNVRLEGPGADDPVFRDYLSNLPVRSGDQLDHERYEAVKSRLGNLAVTRGYIEAAFTRQRVVVNVEAGTADIDLLFLTGPRYRFGQFTFRQYILNDELLRRYSDVDPGDPFDVGALIELNQRLSNSGYYSMVMVRQQRPDREQLTIPVLVEMEPRMRYGYSVRGGFSTDTGPRGGITGEARRINRAGHRITGEIELSPVRSHIGAAYIVPGSNPHTDYTRYSAGFKTEDTDSFDSDIWQVAASRVTLLSSGWKRTTSLTFQQEDYRIDDKPQQRTMLLMPGMDWSRSRADDLLRPRSGWSLNATTRGAAEGILSDTSFVQLHLRGKYIMPLGRGRLLARAEAGGTWVESFTTLPASLRFYTGGDNSVRGYGYEELGPVDSDGNVTGGRNMVAASIEYEWPVLDQFGVAAFYDTGNAFNSFSDFESDLKSSVGIGARWHSPIGPIRVDFAFPLDDSGFRLHLTMGPDL